MPHAGGGGWGEPRCSSGRWGLDSAGPGHHHYLSLQLNSPGWSVCSVQGLSVRLCVLDGAKLKSSNWKLFTSRITFQKKTNGSHEPRFPTPAVTAWAWTSLLCPVSDAQTQVAAMSIPHTRVRVCFRHTIPRLDSRSAFCQEQGTGCRPGMNWGHQNEML